MEQEICKAVRLDGSPCRARPTATGYCFVHEDALEQKRDAARANGNKAKTKQLEKLADSLPPDLQDLTRVLWATLSGTLKGDIPPGRATAAASIAGRLIQAYEVGKMADEVAELREAAEKYQQLMGRVRA